MPPDAITVLLVSEQAEELKLITKSLRSFYPGCRVEVVYSRDEALEWASKQEWHIIILDESLLEPAVQETLQNVRRSAPRSALIVAAARQDTAAALDLMREGADYSLFKDTPAFLTELPIVTREVLEKRNLRTRLDLSQDRYLRLLDNLTDIAYELDAEGRFLYVSRSVQPFLHYDPQELIGLHYSTLIPPDESRLVDRRFNERRTKSRATRRFQLRLLDKDRSLPPVVAEINATALYDRHRQFIGTIGVIRPTLGQQHLHALQRLTDLPTPLTSILVNTEQLLQTVQDLCEQVGLSPSQPRTPPSVSAEAQAREGTLVSTQTPEHDVQQPPSAFVERRRSPRVEIQMDARATSDGTSWQGTALNVSLGGIFLLLKGDVHASEHQMARLGFASEVGVLEIAGSVRHVRTGPGDPTFSKIPVTGLAIEFLPLKEVEAKILHSLLDGLRARSISMTFTALLVRPPSGRQSSEHSAVETDATIASASPRSDRRADRRQAIRVNVSIPAHVDLPSSSIPLAGDIILTNLSIGGACLRLRSSPALRGQRMLLHFSPPALSSIDEQRTEFRLIANIVWTISEMSTTLRNDPSEPIPLRIGLQFLHDPSREPSVAALIGRYLTLGRTHPSGETADVSTEFLEYTNQQGRRLAVCHDRPQDLSPAAPLVLLVPGYGRTKRDYIRLAYGYASNGCHVLRYDHSHHVGESDGGMVQTTLTGMHDDLTAMIAYAVGRWPASPLVIVAADVAARVALKVAARNPPVTLFALLAPVFDLQYTLIAAHQEDLIAAFALGKKRDIHNVLGFNVDADAWLADAVLSKYADFQTTREDLIHSSVPLLVFASEQDPWLRPDASQQVRAMRSAATLTWYAVPEAHHAVVDDPDLARIVFRHMIIQCRARLYPLIAEDTRDASEEIVARQIDVEIERARLQHRMDHEASVAFWRDYLDRSHALVNFSEYWRLLDHIYRLLGPLDNNTRVLDAGCGNGNFGMYLLIMALFGRSPVFSKEHRLRYTGMDIVPHGLERTKANLIRVAAELRGKFAASVPPQSIMKAGLICADLNVPLPFQNGQFDRVVCNLVLGYLQNPLFSLRELMRVLAPHGKLVVTHFRPDADLKHIYRAAEQLERHIVDASDELLSHSGERAFRFFDRQELAMLLLSSGGSQPRIYSTFSNQAYIAVAEKSLNSPS